MNYQTAVPINKAFERDTSRREVIAQWNAELLACSPLQITEWAIAQAKGRAVVSTNFGPYAAVVLHLCAQVQPGIPVLWVDHGYNRPATYRYAERLKQLLRLNVKGYLPRLTPTHRDAIHGPVPGLEDERGLREFSALMKLEPFQRGMRELAPAVWITGLRKAQSPNRAGLDIVTEDSNFGVLKVSPVYHLSDEEMEAYTVEHGLPNEWDYFDPAKGDTQRECGLHARWGAEVLENVFSANGNGKPNAL